MRAYYLLSRLLGLFIAIAPLPAAAQQQVLREQINAIVRDSNGAIGIAMTAFDTMDTLMVAGNLKFPMQSVYKFPLAMAVLDQVDKGKFSLTQKLHVTKKELITDTWSPLRDKYPEGADLELREVLTFTVSASDNNGCDILFRLMGGPAKVNAYVRSLGVNGMAITTTEEEMHHDAKAQYSNASTPEAMLQLLAIFFKGNHLSKTSNDFLWKLMVESNTGLDKIKANLPPGTLVAHKSGYSGVNEKGVISASNDIAIVTLPNGKYFAITIFVSDTADSNEKCSAVIAKIARAAWDYYAFVKD